MMARARTQPHNKAQVDHERGLALIARRRQSSEPHALHGPAPRLPPAHARLYAGYGSKAGFDEGRLSLYLPILICMENPYRFSK